MDDKVILAIGLDDDSIKIVREVETGIRHEIISTPAEVDPILSEEKVIEGVILVLLGEGIEGYSPDELSQSLKMTFTSVPMAYVSSGHETYLPDQLKWNGLDDSFLLPMDGSDFKDFMQEKVALGTGKQIFKAVKLHDIQPGAELGFDLFIFLPANNKYIRYVAADGAISDEQAERLLKHQLKSGYVRMEDLDKFFDFTAEQLKDLQKGEGISETQRQLQLRRSVRSVFSRIFDTSAKSAGGGKKIVEEATNIVSSFISDSPHADLFKKVQEQVAGTEGGYSHATNVSVFAALFSIATEIGSPGEVAIAGMLHDIGKTKMPQDIADLDESMLTLEQEAVVAGHPELSLTVAREKKLVLSESVQKTIRQHHERVDGTGYPKGLKGEQVSPMAQLVGIADEFDYLTRTVPGRKILSPSEVIQRLVSSNKFDQKIILPIVEIFPMEEKGPGGS